MLPSIVSKNETISTVDLREQINLYRVEEGKAPYAHNKFVSRVEDELSEHNLMLAKFASNNPGVQGGSREIAGYNLTHDQALLVGMRESKNVRARVLVYVRKLEADRESRWEDTRENVKAVWEDTQDAIKLFYGEPKHYNYGNEMNMVYRIIFGKSAAQLKKQFGFEKNKPAKDGLTEAELVEVSALEAANALFMNANMEYAGRKVALKNLHNARRLKLAND